MPRIGNRIFWGVLLLPLMAYHGLALARVAESSVFLGMLLAGLPALMVLYSRRLGLSALAISLFICPIFGPTFTSVAMLWFAFVLLCGCGHWKYPLVGKDPLLWIGGSAVCLVFLCGATVSFVKFFDASILASVTEGSGLIALLRYLIDQPSSWERAIGIFLGYLNAFVLLIACRPLFSDPDNRRALELGILLGASFSLVFLVGQVLELHHYFGINRAIFFRYTGRYSASFSDPNAFGLMAYLCIVFLLSRMGHRLWRYFAFIGALMSIGVLWSGSRTYWIGLGFCCVVGVWLSVHTKGRKILLGSVLAGGIAIVGLGWPWLNQGISRRLPLPSTVRILESINWTHASEAADSRLVFGRLALASWSAAPIAGIGAGRFIQTEDSVAKQLGIDLKDWRDNANNYYLQILTEAGVTGLALLGIALCCFAMVLGIPQKSRWTGISKEHLFREKVEEVVPRVLLWSLPVVLLTGPHLAFDEIRYFAALLIAVYAAPITVKWARVLIVFLVVCSLTSLGLSISRMSSQSPQGLYGIEEGGVRWSAKTADFEICPEPGEQLKMRALRPEINYNPLSVEIGFTKPRTNEYQKRALVIYNNDWSAVAVPEQFIGQDDSRINVELELDSIWSPFRDEWSADLRGLGVQIQWNSISCEDQPEVRVAPWAKSLLSVSPTLVKDEIDE